MTAIQLIGALAISTIWMCAWAQLIGMPIAWSRLRRTLAAIGGLSGGALLVVMFGAPAIFVPWAVVNLNVARFPHVAERVRQRKLSGRPERG